jgi:twitching motility protein PilT
LLLNGRDAGPDKLAYQEKSVCKIQTFPATDRTNPACLIRQIPMLSLHEQTAANSVPAIHASSPGKNDAVLDLTTRSVDDLLKSMLQAGEGVSDLFFIAGCPPEVENFGQLQLMDGPALLPEHTEAFAHMLLNNNMRLMADLQENGSCDTSYALEDLARFRVNIFKQKGTFAIVMRKLNTNIPTLEDLGLPPIFKRMIEEKNGIIFVTGATGSGKTTTLAAMLNELNEHRRIHMVTLEDPVEFLHPHKKAIFSQRELGKDFSSFAMGLRAALRQAPKVILVGEIRDRETMEIALTAAETGHLVFATLHTISAGQTINRILGMFDKEEEKQVRDRLAETLRFVVSQRLAPKVGGGRMMVPEIMGSNLRTRETVQLGENELRNLHEIIEAARPDGWCSFEQSLCEAYEKETITAETAMLLAVNKSKMRQALDHLKKRLGRDDTVRVDFKLMEHLHAAPPLAMAPKAAANPDKLRESQAALANGGKAMPREALGR